MALFKKKQEQQIELAVHGMHCNHCKMRVEQALGKVAGVQSVEVSLEHEQAIVGVTSGQEPKVEELIAAVESAGYQAELGE